MFRLGTSFGNFRLVCFAWELMFEFVRFTTFDGELLLDDPGGPERAIDRSKFSDDPEVAPSEISETIEASNFVIGDWEVVLDMPVRLPQSVSPSKVDLNILLGGKLIDGDDLVGGLFGLGGEDRLGDRLVE